MNLGRILGELKESLEENFEERLGQVDQRLGKSETGAGGQLVTGRIKVLGETALGQGTPQERYLNQGERVGRG